MDFTINAFPTVNSSIYINILTNSIMQILPLLEQKRCINTHTELNSPERMINLSLEVVTAS